MKNKKIKKLLSEAFHDIARNDGRIFELELAAGIKQMPLLQFSGPSEIVQRVLAQIPIKDAEHIKPPTESFHKQAAGSKKELTELPEKCFFKIEVQHIEVLNNYIEANKHLYRLYNHTWNVWANYYFRVITKPWAEGHSFAEDMLEEEKKRGFVEISFSDFERLALKSEVEELPKLEIGNWYKNGNALVCYQGPPDKDQGYPTFKAYGFAEDGEWIGPDSDKDSYNGWTLANYWEPATYEEVEAAFISEAKIRYKVGDLVKSVASTLLQDDIIESFDLILYEVHSDLWIKCSDTMTCIFNNGIWAEIISTEQPEPEIDWSMPGQLMISDYDIVMTTGQNTYDTFGAITLQKRAEIERVIVGVLSENLFKVIYRLHTEPVTLKNK